MLCVTVLNFLQVIGAQGPQPGGATGQLPSPEISKNMFSC